MGFFKNLFSKQACVLCSKEVGALSRVKLSDGNYLCSDCRKNTSAFINIQKLNVDEVKKHIEYMEKQNEFYEKVFSTQDDKDLVRCVRVGYAGIVFCDKLGMFEIINAETKKKNYKELFRYDQIKDFEVYGKENTGTGENQKKYAEVGVKIIMDSAADIGNFAANDDQMRRMHPYAMEFILPVERNTDHLNGGMIKNHMNKMFGRPDETLFGSIKESFTGTAHERAGYQAANDAVSALTSFAKGKITGNEEDIEEAKEKAKKAATSGMAYASEFRTQYAEAADTAEKEFMGKTFRDFLYGE